MVSILARPSRAGRPLDIGAGRRDPWVSILARPSRAGRPTMAPSAVLMSLFQSSLGPRGPGVPPADGNLATGRSFNPRSALAGRASNSRMRDSSSASSFNPRSALAGRASWLSNELHPTAVVSILARPSRAGRQAKAHRLCRAMTVSILARPSRAGRPEFPFLACELDLVSILARPSRAGRPPMFQSSLGPRGPGVSQKAPIFS